MSRNTSSNKKRRLVSEQSQASGITILSNVTQTTDLSSDFEDNKSDSSSGNANHGSSSNIFNAAQTQASNPPERNMKRAQRKRQVSWSLDYGDDETFLKECNFKEQGPSPERPPVPYDNNFNGTNNSHRRTRRATESSLDTHGYQSQIRSPFGENTQWVSPIRSNTTSQIHGHENDIQRQRITEEIIRDHDTRMNHQRRSQSVTSLRDPNLRVEHFGAEVQPVNHMYEPLHAPRAFPLTPTRPLETIVTIPNGGPNYIQPVTHVQRGNQSNSFEVLNNMTRMQRNYNISQNGDSSYADVISSAKSQAHGLCCRSCDGSFFRKGFFVLLVLNVIFVLLNVVGLPFLYVAMKKGEPPDPPSEGPLPSANVCVKCDSLTEKDREGLKTPGEENQCCSSTEKIFAALLKGSEESVIRQLEIRSQDKAGAKIPVVQLKASKNQSTTNKNDNIVWDKRPDINTMDADIIGRTTINVPKNGYYYIYSRVHYEADLGNQTKFVIGHAVMKLDKSGSKPIDRVVQRCFPSKSTGDVRHTNHIGSVQYLSKNEKVYVKLDHPKFFDYKNTMFGMFLVAT